MGRVVELYNLLHKEMERCVARGMRRASADAVLKHCMAVRFTVCIPDGVPGEHSILACANDVVAGELQYHYLYMDRFGLLNLEVRSGRSMGLPGESGHLRSRKQGLVYVTEPGGYVSSFAFDGKRLLDVVNRPEYGRDRQVFNNAVTRYAEMLPQVAWPKDTMAPELLVNYWDSLRDAFEETVHSATERYRMVMPNWFRDVAPRLPVESDIETFNFFLDPAYADRRRQAAEAYPAGVSYLMAKEVTVAIDRGEPLGVVLRSHLGISKSQVAKLRSDRLAAALCAVRDRDPGLLKSLMQDVLLTTMRVAPVCVDEQGAALDSAVTHLRAWNVLCRSVSRYKDVAINVDGVPVIEGFSDDGQWGNHSRARQYLGTLHDSLRWLDESVLSVLPAKLSKLRGKAQGIVSSLVDERIAQLKPAAMRALDAQLHGWARIDMKHAPVSRDAMPLLIADGIQDGVRFEQLRTLSDYGEEGAAMHHCVASYAARAECGTYAVWSLHNGNERATLGVLIRLENVGSELKPSYRVRAGLEQVRGPCNMAVSENVAKASEAWVSKLNGSVLLREHFEVFRRNKMASERAGQIRDAWQVVFHERVRERAWALLAPETRQGYSSWRELLTAQLGPVAASPKVKGDLVRHPTHPTDPPGPYDDLELRWK